MNVLNGLQWKPDPQLASPYTSGPRMVRRLIWFWLHHVVGWADIDKTGTAYDDTELTGSDGATDATGKVFSSATGGFDTDWAAGGYFLVVHPTDATSALTGGFTDPERNGFYRIVAVKSANDLVIDASQGVDLEGMPASESGLAFSIVNLQDDAILPVDNDFFVLRGDVDTSGTTFDLRIRERHNVNYGRHYVQVSPYADWDAVAHNWNVSNRVSSEISVVSDPFNYEHWVTIYGGATKNWFWLAVGYANASQAFDDSAFYFAGEFDPFHAADQRPVIVAADRNVSDVDIFGPIAKPQGTNADGTVPLALSGRWMVQHRETSTWVQDVPTATVSRYSGRHIHCPIIITSEVAGYEAVRGQLPFKMTSGLRTDGEQPKVLGATKDFLRIGGWAVFPWNGSNVRNQILGA